MTQTWKPYANVDVVCVANASTACKELSMRIISVRENPEVKDTAISYIQKRWPETLPIIYEDCISHCVHAINPLPQWYLLTKGNDIIGCCGLITNDFISRMDLYPWLCALYIEDSHRGHAYAMQLIERTKSDCVKAGFPSLYLSTQHIGYYEKYGFTYLAQGYHPWGEESRIYVSTL